MMHIYCIEFPLTKIIFLITHDLSTRLSEKMRAIQSKEHGRKIGSQKRNNNLTY